VLGALGVLGWSVVVMLQLCNVKRRNT
jgi:hypothetical protein